MTKSILAISFCALLITACGSSSDDDSSSTTGGTTGGDTGGNTGGDTGGDTGGNTGGDTGGNPTPAPPLGPAPTFGDSAAASNGLPATTTVCPASVTGTFTGWANLGASWCAFQCPANQVDDGDDDWGFIAATQSPCRLTNAAPGAQITAQIFTPDSQEVFVSATANPANDSAYNCASFEFNQTTRVLEDLGSAFSLTLSADNTANDAGTATTWSFSNGVLTLESGRVLTNVAVADGSFSSWQSNTALIRCSI